MLVLFYLQTTASPHAKSAEASSKNAHSFALFVGGNDFFLSLLWQLQVDQSLSAGIRKRANPILPAQPFNPARLGLTDDQIDIIIFNI